MRNKQFDQFPVKQNYQFDIGSVFKRALKLSKQNNWNLAQALLCIVCIYIVVVYIFMSAFNITSVEQILDPVNGLTATQQASIEMTLIVLLAPLWTGVSMLAIYSARNSSKNFTHVFWYYRLLPRLVLGSILISLAASFGLMLFFFPVLYVVTATSFVLPLMADKQMGPISAIIYSIRVVNMHLANMLILCLIFIVLMILVFLSLGFAYLWIGPLYFNVKAVLYQDLFCDLESDTDQTDLDQTDIKQSDDEHKKHKDDGVFDA